jgi:hypothetical protein
MPFTASGKHYSVRAKRWCKLCAMNTEQDMVSNKIHTTPEPTVPLTYIREKEWYCTQCDNIEKETKQVTEPTDKQRIFTRLLRLSEDYDMLKMRIESWPNEIVLRVTLPDFDMGELRAVQYKQQETGFITAEELMKLQRAGFSRPSDVPPRPMPKDRRTLRARARQSMFVGEPRSF